VILFGARPFNAFRSSRVGRPTLFVVGPLTLEPQLEGNRSLRRGFSAALAGCAVAHDVQPPAFVP
jgi:hypothetical protein